MSKSIRFLFVLLVAAYALTMTACSGEPVKINHTWIRPAQPLEVKWKVPEKVTDTAWIGIVPSDTPAGKATHDDPGLEFKYLSGETSGTFTFNTPGPQKKYDVRMYSADTGGKELAAVSFTVSNSLQP